MLRITPWLLLGILLVALSACGGDNTSAGQESFARTPTATQNSPAPTPTASEPTATPTQENISLPPGPLPIADMHFHPLKSWDLVEVGIIFRDERGVALAANGALGGPDSLALQFAQAYPNKYFPFAGLDFFAHTIPQEGEAAWRLQSERVLDFLDQLEQDLEAKRFYGIGELFVNNLRSAGGNSPESRYPADSPLMQRLWSLSAKYGVPLSVHMETEEDSVAEMERLIASDRNGTWIWAHAGLSAEPSLLRPLLAEHPNLYIEISQRESFRASDLKIPIDNDNVLKPEWKQIFEEFPDRFVVGSDIGDGSPDRYLRIMDWWREILGQISPEAAQKIGHENARRLLGLSKQPS